jgi:hypothetical protein
MLAALLDALPFSYPECGGDHQVGHLVDETEICCIICLKEEGRQIRVECWKGGESDPSLLREVRPVQRRCISERLPIFLLPPRQPPFHDLRIVWRNTLPRDLRRPTTTSRRLMVGGKRCRRWQRSFDRGPLPQSLFRSVPGDGRFVALAFCPSTQRTLGWQLFLNNSEFFLELLPLGIGALRHLVFCKALMAKFCLKVVDRVARIGQCALGFLARSGLLPKGLPGGVQLLKAGATVTMNDRDGNFAVAHKVSTLM